LVCSPSKGTISDGVNLLGCGAVPLGVVGADGGRAVIARGFVGALRQVVDLGVVIPGIGAIQFASILSHHVGSGNLGHERTEVVGSSHTSSDFVISRLP
jgi:hypothetical protein